METNAGVTPVMPQDMPQPPAPDKEPKRLSRRELLIILCAAFLLVILAVCFILYAVSAGHAPKQVVNNGTDPIHHVQEELMQVSLPGTGERSAYFYLSGDGLACAVLQRSGGGYRLITALGSVPLAAEDMPGVWMLSDLKSGKTEYLVFGVLYDPDLSEVEVDGMPAVVINTGQYRFWYYLVEGNVSINSESIAYR